MTTELQKKTKNTSSERTRQDAGKMGGEATKKRHGSDHFRKIGRQGGKARRQKRVI